MNKGFVGILLFALGMLVSTSYAASPIRSTMNNKCLDVPGGNFLPGVELIMWDCNRQTNQLFEFTPQGEIRIAGLCVDAYGGRGGRGDRIGLWSCHGGQNQKWRKEGSTIKGINNRCIDIAGGNTAKGAKLLLWDCHGGVNQNWITEEALSPPSPQPPTGGNPTQSQTKGCKPGAQCGVFMHNWYQNAGMGTHVIRISSTGDYEDQWLPKAQPGFFPATPAPRSGTWISDGSTISLSGLGTATLVGSQLQLNGGALYTGY